MVRNKLHALSGVLSRVGQLFGGQLFGGKTGHGYVFDLDKLVDSVF